VGARQSTPRRDGGGVAASPARRVAFAVLRRTFEDGAYADRALSAEAARAGVSGRELALATRLAYGAVQRRRTLDHLAERLAGRPAAKLDPPILAALRLGLLQLHFLDGIPARAAVHESVELAKAAAPRGAGLVNAVLRRAAEVGPPDLPDATPAEAALAHSVPDWLAELWWEWLGAGEARALLGTVNDPPEAALRVNALVPADLSGVPAHPAGDPPEALVLDGPWDAWSSPEWKAGAIFPQGRASMRVARTLAPEPGERVLDLCSAPGGKTTHLAALMEDRGEVVAVERNRKRAARLREVAARLNATIVRVEEADAADFAAPAPFDRVLLDPPCSGLGTLQTRPDVRWRTSPERIAEAAGLQARILECALAALKPGGTLVYSVCTLSPREEPPLPWASAERLLPHRTGTEGFFIGRLEP
jgi:16S rRNA (cytosine967-C5)-methyltransferase